MGGLVRRGSGGDPESVNSIVEPPVTCGVRPSALLGENGALLLAELQLGPHLASFPGRATPDVNPVQLSAHMGALFPYRATEAAGAAPVLETGLESCLGVEGWHRSWLGRDLTLDLSVGALPKVGDDLGAPLLTAEAGISWKELGVVGGVHSIRQRTPGEDGFEPRRLVSTVRGRVSGPVGGYLVVLVGGSYALLRIFVIRS